MLEQERASSVDLSMSLMTNSGRASLLRFAPQAHVSQPVEPCSPFVQARHKPHTGRRSASSFPLLPRLTNSRRPLAVSRDVRAARVFELRCPKKKSFACLRAQGFCRGREDNPERTGPFQLHSFIEKVSVELSYWLVVEIVADSKRNPWRVR